MFDLWQEAVLEAAVEVVEEDPRLAEYEVWEEAAGPGGGTAAP
jgi:hypothetical protein